MAVHGRALIRFPAARVSRACDVRVSVRGGCSARSNMTLRLGLCPTRQRSVHESASRCTPSP
eukprot:3850782-Prymnesium_polylepis.1